MAQTVAHEREGGVGETPHARAAAGPRSHPSAELGDRVAGAFSSEVRAIALAFAEAAFPPGRMLPGAGPASVARVERVLAGFGAPAVRGYAAMLRALEWSTVARHGKRFSRLSAEQRERTLVRWLRGGSLRHSALFALTLPLRNVHFEDPETFRRLGCVWDRSGPAEPARWWQQVRRAADLSDEDIECDVVVVGTGAGGAVAAHELAAAGLAVVMIEEGEYHTRADFTGRTSDAIGKLYRGPGETFTIGNAIIPIPLGRTVGGSTAVNSGTCFRTPDTVLDRWRAELGLSDFTPESMQPFFEQVESDLGVSEARAAHLGGAARVVARGCDTLGWSHHPLRRNAPECDGQGVCVLGCPTDAKRSTNVSYVPMALERAAMLVTGLRAERVLTEDGRAAGIEARVVGDTRTRRIRARAVVLACGTLLTPALLLRQRLLRSRALGRNLTIHPAIAASALFGEELRAWDAIPQGYCVDQFHDRGILMEGCTPPLESGPMMFNMVGRELMDMMERYDRVASFGAMVSERQGAGRVQVLPGGRAVVRYTVSEDVRRRLHEAMVSIGEMFFAAGAERIFPAMQGISEIRSPEELRAFAVTRPRARDFSLSAYHPLGTCRIGADPQSSVLEPSHEARELPGLYVCDGSAVPTSPTVNPQITIMAMAMRAARGMAHRLLN